jgi:hypothetical protein
MKAAPPMIRATATPKIPVIPEKPTMLLDGDAEPDAFLVPAAADPDGFPVAPAEDPDPVPVPELEPAPVPVMWSELVWLRVINEAGWSMESEVKNVDAVSSVAESNAPVTLAPEAPELEVPELEVPELEGDIDAVKDGLSAVLFYVQSATQLM